MFLSFILQASEGYNNPQSSLLTLTMRKNYVVLKRSCAFIVAANPESLSHRNIDDKKSVKAKLL